METELLPRALARHEDALCLALLSALFCGVTALGLYLKIGYPIPLHSPFDQHTLQAQAWLNGDMTIPFKAWHETASYKGNFYNSFPPTPTLVELLFVPWLGLNTPSAITLIAFAWIGLVVLYLTMRRFGHAPALSGVVALTYVCGSNLLASYADGGIWGQGQVYGFTFALLAINFASARRASEGSAILAWICLAFAVGCRPFYLLMAPALLAFELRCGPAIDRIRIRIRRAVTRAIFGMSPYLLFMAWYNYERFDSPFEFGHTYLPHSLRLPHGVFSWFYMPRNLTKVFLTLPMLGDHVPLVFRGRGTAFWLNNGILMLALVILLRDARRSHFHKIVVASIFAIWIPLLMHESNGWYQFGSRYVIDIMPLSFIAILLGLKRLRPSLVALSVFSIALNLYGMWWFGLRMRI